MKGSDDMKGIVVQVSIDIHVMDKADYDIGFEEDIKAVLENAGYEVCGADCVVSWDEDEYFK